MAKRYELHLDAENEDWLHREENRVKGKDDKKEDDKKSKDKKKKASVDNTLRNEVIKLAYEKPELREILLPIITE